MIELKNESGETKFMIHKGKLFGSADPYYGFWIRKPDGEGMFIYGDKFLECLEKFYNENF